MLDLVLPTLLKSINVDDILKKPEVVDALAFVRQIADDFRVIREKVEKLEKTQEEIMRQLDGKIETSDDQPSMLDRMNDHHNKGYVK